MTNTSVNPAREHRAGVIREAANILANSGCSGSACLSSALLSPELLSRLMYDPEPLIDTIVVEERGVTGL